jgi:RHS repeat-associated protein
MPIDYYPLQDLLYRTTALTNAVSDIVETYDTDAYGNTLIFNDAGTGGDWWADDATQTGDPINAYIFTGRRYDPETEIYYYRARYYDPSQGRFISRDPFGYVDDLSMYAYVSGMAAIRLDPFGKRKLTWDEWWEWWEKHCHKQKGDKPPKDEPPKDEPPPEDEPPKSKPCPCKCSFARAEPSVDAMKWCVDPNNSNKTIPVPFSTASCIWNGNDGPCDDNCDAHKCKGFTSWACDEFQAGLWRWTVSSDTITKACSDPDVV